MSEVTTEREALEEQRLANDLFGNVGDNSGFGVPGDADTELQAGEDSTLATGSVLFLDDRDTTVAPTGSATKKRPAPVWEDEDDATVEVDLTSQNRMKKLQKVEGETIISGKEYSARLREQHKKMQAAAGQKWAEMPDEKSDEEEDDDVADPLRRTGAIVDEDSSDLSGPLASGVLKIERLKDANKNGVSKATISSVRFHREKTQLMMTAGLDKTLRLFSVDGEHNHKIQSVFIRDLPIVSGEFFPTRNEIILAGRRPFFYVYDLVSGNIVKVPKILGRKEKSFERFVASPNGDYLAFQGNDGYIVLLSGKTKQWVANLKMNGSVRSLSFSPDGNFLLSSGGDGEVYTWDMRTLRCFNRHKDEGCVHSTALAAGTRYYACGSNDGVVNLYDSKSYGRAAPGTPTPSPTKSFMSLTTRLDCLKFSHDENMMVYSSMMQKDALKICHVPSQTVFSNWPTSQTPLHYVSSVDFTANSGMLAIGNDRGKVLLYRLQHYGEV